MPKGIYPRCSRLGCTRKQLDNSVFCSEHFTRPAKAVKPRKPRKSPNQKVQASRAANPTLEKLIRKIVREEITRATMKRPDLGGLEPTQMEDLAAQISAKQPWSESATFKATYYSTGGS